MTTTLHDLQNDIAMVLAKCSCMCPHVREVKEMIMDKCSNEKCKELDDENAEEGGTCEGCGAWYCELHASALKTIHSNHYCMGCIDGGI